ncbi:MAG: DUF397 domain-containing protein [Streptosporangiaceae bacterium]
MTKWRKSSVGFTNGNCVEVASLRGGEVGVRNSKGPHGPILRYTPEEWNAFLADVRTGEFDTFGVLRSSAGRVTMGGMPTVQLRFVGRETAAVVGRLLDVFPLARLIDPGLSGGPVVQISSADADVVGIVTLESPGALGELTNALARWMNRHRGKILMELSAAGETAQIQRGDDPSEIRRILQSLITLASETELGATEVEIKVGIVKGRRGRGDDLPRDRADLRRVTFALEDPDDAHRAMALIELIRLRSQEAENTDALMMPVTIYLSNEEVHQQVEAAIEGLLAAAGLHVESRDEPILGSWFRHMVAAVKQMTRSPAGREATLVAAHVADTHLVLAQDAAVTAALLQNLGPVLGALQPTKDAVIRVGALLNREGGLDRERLPVDGRAAGRTGSSPTARPIAPRDHRGPQPHVPRPPRRRRSGVGVTTGQPYGWGATRTGMIAHHQTSRADPRQLLPTCQ